ncbi:2Fe-2S iron-sulfur cluster binding domain-containing protein [Magnetospira sp. QH-2]|uniref:2Fe-2S iron-sulfur cluster binding domain-containing protein n=1 Tax=Magnetospira sp. (strain QH-2) TaxID=1288970 RepID=UPI0003E80E13|nr:2Fe-2S iron-sulfur cluster binding domain-containing protein [Magnetospira sp. QH-2]CCQ72608.1 Ferredoxin, plant-type (modular protein) [Magnetospira sp. QH-2]
MAHSRHSGKFAIRVEGDPRTYFCAADQKVIAALEECGQIGIRVGCREGGCGVCRVRVVSGEYETGKMSRAHVSEEQESQGFALSCRLFPRSNLHLEAAGIRTGSGDRET